MKIVVCVKYVPVVARIQFDYENKTIIREGVPSEVNPFDMLGLVRAVELTTFGALGRVDRLKLPGYQTPGHRLGQQRGTTPK